MAPVPEQKCVENRIRSFIILDLETTGLPCEKPVKITEVSLVAALREHIIEYGNYNTGGVALPRVLSKLTLCVDPRRRISQRATDITHLTNELLEHQSPFDEQLFNMLDGFMKKMPQPVCIIAHNGIRFDFPILQAELFRIGKAFPDHIMCADSLRGFQNLLQASKSAEATNGNHTTIASSILSDIQPLNSDIPQYKKATNQARSQPNTTSLSFEVTELHLHEYDEALCLAVDAAEVEGAVAESNNTDNLTSNNTDNLTSTTFHDADDILCSTALDTVVTPKVKDECKVISDSPHVEKRRNPMDIEVSLFQNILEKTPDRPVTVGGKYPNPATGDSCAVTPKVETSVIVKRERGHGNASCRARKRLNFSSKKKPDMLHSFKLDDVYKFILKRDRMNGHAAENDALDLLECIVALGHSFTEWVDENAVQFNSIKRMG